MVYFKDWPRQYRAEEEKTDGEIALKAVSDLWFFRGGAKTWRLRRPLRFLFLNKHRSTVWSRPSNVAIPVIYNCPYAQNFQFYDWVELSSRFFTVWTWNIPSSHKTKICRQLDKKCSKTVSLTQSIKCIQKFSVSLNVNIPYQQHWFSGSAFNTGI